MKAKRIFCLVVILLVGVGLFFLLDRWVFPKETYIHETHSARLVCADGTEVYDAVEALKVGDVIDLEGFLYWYNGAQPHITSVVVK